MDTEQKLIGSSPAVLAVEEDIECAAASDAKVLIAGESGVGKEVVARLIHQRSRRRRGPLITVNCAGVPDTLLASELFGHVRGSFTDAHRDRRGLLEQANGGTIFLDEVGEMSPQMQSLLLRFLDRGEIQQVGAAGGGRKVDVRVITATNRRLIERVQTNDFREDLFYRLNVIHIDIPPLRVRRDDIPLLLEYFLNQHSDASQIRRPKLSADALAVMSAFDWPGNVRQLKNVTERLVVRFKSETEITAVNLPREILSGWPASRRQSVTEGPGQSAPDRMFRRLVEGGESFWTVVHDPFMDRDITRKDLRTLVALGLDLAHGNQTSCSPSSIFNRRRSVGSTTSCGSTSVSNRRRRGDSRLAVRHACRGPGGRTVRLVTSGHCHPVCSPWLMSQVPGATPAAGRTRRSRRPRASRGARRGRNP